MCIILISRVKDTSVYRAARFTHLWEGTIGLDELLFLVKRVMYYSWLENNDELFFVYIWKMNLKELRSLFWAAFSRVRNMPYFFLAVFHLLQFPLKFKENINICHSRSRLCVRFVIRIYHNINTVLTALIF